MVTSIYDVDTEERVHCDPLRRYKLTEETQSDVSYYSPD